ncbi:MAG: protein kinase [Myxococcales bacterium]|nr:protein kinase [Myxococcales bacterium]
MCPLGEGLEAGRSGDQSFVDCAPVSSLGGPTWFGRYRLTSRIATGGMAEVYVGRHISEDGKFGPMVAVKRLLPHLVSDSQVVRMFLNEARITAQIDHPNVVRILALGHENGEPFIAMELLEGRSLAEIRARAAEDGKRVPLGITLRILADACRGLDAAHRAVDEEGCFLCIVHRDFTPDNIHVGVAGEVKVIDFGIGKSKNWGAGTEPGTLKGKFFYMSPEMIVGKPVDHRADLFAAGVMLYEQLCGRRPFTGNSTDEVVSRIAEGKPKRPTEFDPSVPPALDAICLMALHKDPEHRFPSLQEFISAIESVGGIASVADSAEVGAYVSELFPAEKDPRRQTLRRARQADPSHAGGTSRPSPAEPPAQAPAEMRPPRFRPSKKAVLVTLAAALSVAAVGAAATYWLTRPEPTPAQRLAKAEAAADPKERSRLLGPIASDPRASAAQLARAGQLQLAAQDYEGALLLSEKLAARFKKDPRAPLIEARAAIRLRLGKRAEAALDRAAALAPNDVEPDLMFAELRQMQGDRYGALDALTRALKKKPGSHELASRRGYLLSQTGQLEEAASALEAVLAKRFDADSAAELAFVRFRQRQTDEALSLLRRALKKEPQLHAAHYYLGAVLYRQGEGKAAERAYREADRLAPEDPRALVALCELQAQTRSASLEETRKVLAARFPKQPELLAQCAR